jgi:hypothetical protein
LPSRAAEVEETEVVLLLAERVRIELSPTGEIKPKPGGEEAARDARRNPQGWQARQRPQSCATGTLGGETVDPL